MLLGVEEFCWASWMTWSTVGVVIACIGIGVWAKFASNKLAFYAQLSLMIASVSGLCFIASMVAVAAQEWSEAYKILGAVIVGIFGLSGTTLLGNALAGIHLRIVGAFRINDFLRVSEHFGKVTVRGLFHTEIQVPDSDLTTFPNLYLVNNPYDVVRQKQTVISTTFSLGYDVPRSKIEPLLKEAVEATELTDPAVEVLELGDYAVTYRVSGLYKNVKYLLTRRSDLCENVMDILQKEGIEIASPTLMDQRPKPEKYRYMPPVVVKQEVLEEVPVEVSRMDKAEEVKKETVETELEKLDKQIQKKAEEIEKAKDDEERNRLLGELRELEDTRKSLEED